MTLLNTINVGGTDYGINGAAVKGSCATPAGSEIKVCTFSDNFELKAGDMLLVKFTYANTYGDGSTTYPKLQVNNTNYALRRADGNYLQSGDWGNNTTLTFLFDGTDFILPAGSAPFSVTDTVEEGNMNVVTSNAVAESLSYSTTEHKTGKKWIDGKDIWGCVFPCNTTVTTVSDEWTGNIENSFTGLASILPSIDTIISVIINRDAKRTIGGFLFDGTNGHFQLSTHTGWNILADSGFLTLEYTKVTSST